METDIDGIGTVEITAETDYPWDGRVKLTVGETPSTLWTLSLRIPGWVERATVVVNGGAPEKAVPGTYFTTERGWKNGDVVELDLPMTVKLIKAHPMVEEARNQVAVVRGPVVYCLEGVDMPHGAPVHRVALPSDFVAADSMVEDFAGKGRVLVLEGTAYEEADHDEKRLYEPLIGGDMREMPVAFIPYYAWNNRGKNDMTVWLPVIRRSKQ